MKMNFKVLVVDDEYYARKALVMMLEKSELPISVNGDFEDGEDIDIVPKNFILIYKNLDDKYYICIKRWAYRDWDYTLREWEFKEKK